MKVVTKNIEFDLFNSNFLTSEVIELLKSSSKIYLIPQSLYQHLKSMVDNDRTLNTTKYWISCLDLYSSILQGINSSKHLKDINYDYNIILNEWRNGDILEYKRGRYDKKTGKTFTYEFKDTSSYCFVSLIDDNKVIEKCIDVELDSFYKDTLLNCEIDIERAMYDEYINKESLSKFIKRVTLIFNFLGKRYIKRGDKVNRWYNSFSSLTSISRKYVKLNGEYFYEMDLSNAQPSLLCKYLMDNYDIFDENYINKTSNGEFYESIMELASEMGIEGENTWDKDLGCLTFKRFSNRGDVKKLCYQNIFFAQKQNTEVFKLFNRLYPNTWRLLSYELNSGDEKLATILQNMEADIFLNIKPECNYFTVHDAIYIQDKSFGKYVQDKVVELMGTDKFTLGCDFDKQDEKRISFNITIDKVGGTNIFLIEDVNKKPNKNSNKEEILRLRNLGWQMDKIIEHLKISRKTYYKWIKI